MNYKFGDILEVANNYTGYFDREPLRAISEFKSERKYADFLTKMYVDKFSLFTSYSLRTLEIINSHDCTLSEIDKAKTSAVIQALISICRAQESDKNIKKRLEHEAYQDSLFIYLDAQKSKRK